MSLRAEAAALAGRWGRKHPDLADRLRRAVEIVDGVRPAGPCNWLVPSSDGTPYLVTADPERRMSDCPCADSTMRRRGRCKHRLAAAMVYAISRGV